MYYKILINKFKEKLSNKFDHNNYRQNTHEF